MNPTAVFEAYLNIPGKLGNSDLIEMKIKYKVKELQRIMIMKIIFKKLCSPVPRFSEGHVAIAMKVFPSLEILIDKS